MSRWGSGKARLEPLADVLTATLRSVKELLSKELFVAKSKLSKRSLELSRPSSVEFMQRRKSMYSDRC